jgi:hypothetical protein
MDDDVLAMANVGNLINYYCSDIFHVGVYHAFPSSACILDKAKPETCGDVFGLK